MELHKAIKEIVEQQGSDIIKNVQVINFLLDYRAFADKPATKLILRDIINSGYAEEILALKNEGIGWQIKFKKYQHEFIDACGYKEELAVYVFDSIAYALGMNVEKEEPRERPAFNVDSFFPITEVPLPQSKQLSNSSSSTQQNDPTDFYTIALTFYNNGKYKQAHGFAEKALSLLPQSAVPSLYIKLIGDIYLKLGKYNDAISSYNECLNRKAVELKINTNDLRDALTQHRIKGYEDSLFCYYYCLYKLQQITENQWLSFVKKEAIYGLNEAIEYCAANGINPIEQHVDVFFSDRNEIRDGDYLYIDGTISHEFTQSKKAIGEFHLMPTTDFEKRHGWNHGYIFAIENAKPPHILSSKNGFLSYHQGIQWSTETIELPFPHSHYTIDDLNHWDKAQKIDSECFISFQDINKYPAFDAVKKYQYDIPILGTSPWFIPSVILIKKFVKTIANKHRSYGNYFGNNEYWTSSQSDASNAISFRPSYDPGRYGKGFYETFSISVKTEEKHVLPVAAF